ncbi:MAG TPA: GlsB/YeaQ/YmgE family stress response membrane protein [Propionibacteriaceae bacterium]|nr:GlsB/YeaQ/YmgE family stress response membrane protein [Propionibacteriaceae bacterium]
MIGTIIGLIVIGLLAGFIARAVVPGRQSMSILQTILLGIVGSFVGGFLGRLLFGSGDGYVQPSSWIGSAIGAVIVLLVYLLIKRGSRTPASTAG